jgi:hypothetical protein
MRLAASWIVWLGLAVLTSFVITSEIFMKRLLLSDDSVGKGGIYFD